MQVMKELQRFRLKQKRLDKLNQQHSKSLKDIEESLSATKNTIQNLYEEYDNDIDAKGEQYLKDLRIEVRNIENILSQEDTSQLMNIVKALLKYKKSYLNLQTGLNMI